MLIRFVTTRRTIGRIFGDTLGRFRKKGTTINWNSPADTKKCRRKAPTFLSTGQKLGKIEINALC